jgi:N,N'-diacetyllegionaminate synthase
MNEFEIAGRKIGPGYPCFIIAEAGVNHNGDVELARRLIDVAVEAGADAVKFQSFKAEGVVSASAPKAEYQMETTNTDESQLDMLRQLELSRQAHLELQAYCQERSILFLSTPFDRESVDLLVEMDVPGFKIGSGEVNSLPHLAYIASKGKPVILSTGMSYLGEVEEAVRVMRDAGCPQIAVLHCVSNYPAEPSDINLKAIPAMAAALNVPVGFSDHTVGNTVPLAAVAIGACIIEKHFTLDKTMTGPDHRASVDPEELKLMIQTIRSVESALGTGIKAPAAAEEHNREIVRRSVAAASDIAKGEVLNESDLTLLRPGSGIPPSLLPEVAGRTARKDFRSGEIIAWSDLE